MLEGIRIIDLTMVYAGPVATKIMAELGAEVIKVESGQRADVFTRANVYPENIPGRDPWNRGSLFHSLNAGKRGISLNLGTEKGRDILKQLVQKSHAIIENFSPRVMENWGLSYEELSRINPKVVMVSISGLGHYGPLRDYYMYVPGMEGMSGLTWSTGYPDEPPLMSGYAHGDWVTGASAAMALITGLYHQKKTGVGQYIDISGREANACHLGDVIMDCTLNKRNRMRAGNRHPRWAPHGCYQCRGDDNWITIAVRDNKVWDRLREALGNPEWSRDERFASAKGRLENQSELDSLIEKWTRQQDKFEAMETLQRFGIPAGAVLSMKEVNLNPHLRERGFFQMVDHGEEIGIRPLPSQIPAKFSGIGRVVLKRAPRFNEDAGYVLESLLGMSQDDIKRLQDENVVNSLPAFPMGRPTRLDLIERQQAGFLDSNYLQELTKHFGHSVGMAGGGNEDQAREKGKP